MREYLREMECSDWLYLLCTPEQEDKVRILARNLHAGVEISEKRDNRILLAVYRLC